MASPCIIVFNGKEYSYEDFTSRMHDGLLDKLVSDKIIDDSGFEKSGNKKALLNRAFEGENTAEVKAAIEKHGLTYETESRAVAKEKAKKFIDEVGEEAATDAVRKNEVDGAMGAYIWAEAIDSVTKKLGNATAPAEIERLTKMQADLLNEFDMKAREGGRFISALADVYATSDFNYSAERQIKKYKEANNGEISPAVEQRFRELDEQLKDVQKRLEAAEQRAKDNELKSAIDNITADVKHSKKGKGTITGKQRIAKGLDDLASALGAKLSATGDQRVKVIDALTEIGRGLIEEGIATAENVAQKVREYVNDKFGGKVNFDDYADDFDISINAASEEINAGRKLRIPKQAIRDLVEQGITDPNQLVAEVKKMLIDKHPNITDREIRDAISEYGKTTNPKKDEVSRQIRKAKRIMRAISALEDIQDKKRPLKSGAQRDKFDADERAAMKEVREAMKDMPLDAEQEAEQLKTALDAAKQRVQNQIDDLQREIDKGEQVPKSARTVQADEELTTLKQKRDALKEQHDKMFKDEEFQQKRRLELAKRRAQNKINELNERLRTGNFDKRTVKPVIADTELTKLNAEKLRIQEEFDKERYKVELKNRSKAEKVKDSLWELWGIPRILMATGEMSYIGVQGLKQSIAHPTYAAKALKNSIEQMFSEKKSEEFLRNIKAQEWYPTAKASKLALTEPNAKITASEELFYSGWTNLIWDTLGKAIVSPAKLKSGESYQKAVEAWSKANPLKAAERGAVGYLDTIRIMRFLDGMQMLEMQGKNFEENKQDYKDVADVINTLTGRASLGKLNQFADTLSKVFFSPRNWASGIKTATPYALYYFGRMTPTARRMALADFSKFLGLTTSMMILAAAKFNKDEDEETKVELDPRSTDFMKIKLGDTRVDPWGGMQQQVVFSSRIIADALYKLGKATDKDIVEGAYKKGDEVMPLGMFRKTPKASELAIKQAVNKLNPAMSLLYNYANTSINKDGEVKGEYGKDYTLKSELSDKFNPIFWETVSDLLKDDPTALDGLLTFYAFFGGGVQTYDNKTKKEEEKKSAPAKFNSNSGFKGFKRP